MPTYKTQFNGPHSIIPGVKERIVEQWVQDRALTIPQAVASKFDNEIMMTPWVLSQASLTATLEKSHLS